MEKLKGTIKACTNPKEYQGKMQIGFTLKESDSWFNVSGEETELNILRETQLKKGNEIEFEHSLDGVGEIKVLKEAEEKTDSKENSDVVNIKGKDFVTYAGLLKKAHEKGLVSIEIIDSWVSEDMKIAWCKVRAKFAQNKKEMFFDGFGSSTPENTGEMTKSHPVEMAHTRAKARSLRDGLNIGMAAIEELKK